MKIGFAGVIVLGVVLLTELHAHADFTVPGEFHYKINGVDVGLSPGPDQLRKELPGPSVDEAMAAGQEREAIDSKFAQPIRAALAQAKAAQNGSGPRYQAIKRAINEASASYKAFRASPEFAYELGDIARAGLPSDTDAYKIYWAWRGYMDSLGRAVEDGRGVLREIRRPVISAAKEATGPTRSAIESIRKIAFDKITKLLRDFREYVEHSQVVAGRGTTPSADLLAAARKDEGCPYGEGHRCSDLIIKAADRIGLHVETWDKEPDSVKMTTRWYNHGMGTEFETVHGTADGIGLHELIDKIRSGEIRLNPGDVLVSPQDASGNGHAALFEAVIPTRPNYFQIQMYDANNTKAKFSYVAFPDGDADAGTTHEYPCHKTGEHVAPSQWNPTLKIKVFRPLPRPA